MQLPVPNHTRERQRDLAEDGHPALCLLDEYDFVSVDMKRETARQLQDRARPRGDCTTELRVVTAVEVARISSEPLDREP
jgi:hypothetical protein